MTQLLERLRDHLGNAYHIERELGGGGMSRVIIAREAALDRAVVLKVLNPELAQTVSAERFRREIAVLARLQHPHVVPLFSAGAADGLLYYTMPLVEGETLRARLEREGELPIVDALRIGRDVATALGYAHRNGIVHRDIKPDNILLSDGGALVADFGIAKALAAARTDPGAADSDAGLTEVGTAVGTPAYMSPEQISGDHVDHRADIYAFGAVMYEMLCGVAPFAGRNLRAIMAAHATEKPEPISKRRPSAPEPVSALVMSCLEKHPADRPSNAEEIVRELDRATTTSTSTSRSMPLQRAMRSPLVAWSLATLGLIAAAIVILRGNADRATSERVALSALTEPGSQQGVRIAVERGFALSPDGSRVAYVVEKAGVHSLWIRPLDALTGTEVRGAEDPGLPFWSPDGTRLGYFAGGQLHVRTLETGDDRALCPAPFPEGGSWGADDVIVYAPELRGVIHSASAAGGECAAITTLTGNQLDHRRPTFLPDGRHFIYGSGSAGAVFVGDVRTKAQRLVRPGIRYATFANGYLLYVKDAALFAQPFDDDELAVTGEPKRMLDGVSVTIAGRPLLSTSATTLLVATQPPSANTIRHVAIPAAGSTDSTTVIDSRIDARGVALSHDGNLLAVGTFSGIYLYDTERGTRSRLASSDTSPQFGLVTWSPGDSLVAYNHFGGGDLGIRLADVRSDTTWSLLPSPQNFMGPLDWAPDGRSIVFATTGGAGKSGLYLLDMATRSVRPLVEKMVAFSGASFSPDGRWLAYGSTESGSLEVYIIPVATPGAAIPVTRDGGMSPQWRGREIYYVAPSRGVAAVTVTPGPRPRFSEPRYIIRDPFFTQITMSRDARELYAAHATGERILTVMQNWSVKAAR